MKEITATKMNKALKERPVVQPSAQYRELLDIIAEIIASDFLKQSEKAKGGPDE